MIYLPAISAKKVLQHLKKSIQSILFKIEYNTISNCQAPDYFLLYITIYGAMPIQLDGL